MRAKTIKPTVNSTFKDFYDYAPEEIQNILDKSKLTPQTSQWHPEASGDVTPHNVLAHTQIVFNRAKDDKNIDMMIAAIFHDLGKVFVTTKDLNIPGKWSAKTHEIVSTQLVEKYRNWIESLGGDYEKIHYIVSQHMRAKEFNNMRSHKQNIFSQHKYYDDVNKFTEYDNMLMDYSNDINN